MDIPNVASGAAPDSEHSPSILNESTSHSVPWYQASPRPTHLTPSICSFFSSYSGVNEAEVDQHVITIREQAWKIRPYPCVGSFSFLDFSLRDFPIYASLVHLLKSGEKIFVDLGCCFGQNLRWLASDGVPTNGMIAIDLLPDFWELSFNLFRDKDKMHARFIVGDVLDEGGCQEISELKRKVDVIFAGNVLHLFNWQDQVKIVRRAISCSKGVGSVICGEMIGMVEARSKVSGWGKSGTTHFWQDEQSWRRLWREVEGDTGTIWALWVEVVKTSELGERYKYMGNLTSRMRFVCTREE